MKHNWSHMGINAWYTWRSCIIQTQLGVPNVKGQGHRVRKRVGAACDWVHVYKSPRLKMCVHATKHPTRMYNMLCCIRTTGEMTAALNTDQNCHGKTHKKTQLTHCRTHQRIGLVITTQKAQYQVITVTISTIVLLHQYHTLLQYSYYYYYYFLQFMLKQIMTSAGCVIRHVCASVTG